jgi:glycosyltransferase involved in cell wall biosynthesis
MRIKNGADFLEPTIRSHIAHVDEIVALHNGSTDGSPEILARLAQEFAPKLRVIHYAETVFPPGSAGHASEPPDSPRSFVNASNCALAATRYRIAVKVDDDHLALAGRLARTVAAIRTGGYRLDHVLCFSGLNLARDDAGTLGVLAREPFSGGGDIGFFEVTPRTRFIHDARFETFDHDGRRRIFGDFLYWHLKFLKAGLGFANYDLARGDNPRFERKREEFIADRKVISVAELRRKAPPMLGVLGALPLPDRLRFRLDRWRALKAGDFDLSSIVNDIAATAGRI